MDSILVQLCGTWNCRGVNQALGIVSPTDLGNGPVMNWGICLLKGAIHPSIHPPTRKLNSHFKTFVTIAGIDTTHVLIKLARDGMHKKHEFGKSRLNTNLHFVQKLTGSWS